MSLRIHEEERRPVGHQPGTPKTPGSGRQAEREEPRDHLVSGRVSKTVHDLIDSAGKTDGDGIEALIRELLASR